MSNIFGQSAAFLSAKRHSAMTETVVYKRGSDEVSILATVGRAADQDQELDGFVLDAERVDFILRAEDLVLDSQLTEPQEGDEIEFNNGTTTRTYEVRPDGSESVFKYCDEHGIDIRVHTHRGADL